ncbi:hypothetical protein ES707_14266 [subsurface metagenome]
MSKEYLDRKEVERLLSDFIRTIIIKGKSATKEDLDPAHLTEFINNLCQLKPKNQITKEKITEVLGKYGVICGLQEKYKKQLSIINYDTLYEFYGIIANEILEEE